jgi:repressor LexA
MSDEKDKQSEIYEFLKTYTESKGYPPSVREICEAVSLRSTSTVHGHLKRLEKKGMIKRDPSKPRALEIAELSTPKKEMINIPIVGKITAGLPILATENIEDTFSLPLDFIKHDKELFILRVSGESMVNVGIRDNDLAIIESSQTAINGDIVVALIEDSATIKRFFKEKDHIRLQPENDNMDPILVDDCKILGKLVGIFRSFK